MLAHPWSWVSFQVKVTNPTSLIHTSVGRCPGWRDWSRSGLWGRRQRRWPKDQTNSCSEGTARCCQRRARPRLQPSPRTEGRCRKYSSSALRRSHSLIPERCSAHPHRLALPAQFSIKQMGLLNHICRKDGFVNVEEIDQTSLTQFGSWTVLGASYLKDGFMWASASDLLSWPPWNSWLKHN